MAPWSLCFDGTCASLWICLGLDRVPKTKLTLELQQYRRSFSISKAKNLFLNIERQHGNKIRVWFNQKKEGRVLELLYYYETSSSLIYCLCKREYRLNCPAIFVSNCLDSQFSCLNYPNLLSHFNFVLLLHVMLGYQWTIVPYLSIIMATH